MNNSTPTPPRSATAEVLFLLTLVWLFALCIAPFACKVFFFGGGK